MPEHEDAPQKDPRTKSPEDGYPVDTTEPHGGLAGDEGRVNADATPKIADDAEEGQTTVPAPGDDANDAESSPER